MSMRTAVSALGLVLAAAGGLAGRADAQCTGQWLPGGGVPGITGTVYASTMWDPDGAGPQAPVLVVGGAFTLADSTLVTNIAYWDGVSWHALGSGLGTTGAANSPRVNALAVYNGTLVAGGTFTSSGATTLGAIARWTGSAWTTFNTGTTKDFGATSVNALAAAPGGDLIVGGTFTTAGTNTTGTIPANRLARWNGTQWLPLDPTAQTTVTGSFSASNSPVRTLNRASGSYVADGFAVNGKVAISGFTTAANNKATVTISAVTATTLTFSATGFGSAFVAETANATITRLDAGASGEVDALAYAPDGTLIAAGNFTTIGTTAVPSTTVNRIARWNGTAWSRLGSGLASTVTALAVNSNGDVIAGGLFSSAPATIAGQPATPATNFVIRWDTASGTWNAMDSGVGTTDTSDANVRALAVLPSGDVVAGGEFWTANGVYVGELARWNGSAWSAIWTSADPRVVTSLLVRPDGMLVVGGSFTSASGVGADGVAAWDGGNWNPITAQPQATSGAVTGIQRLGNDVYAGGKFANIEGSLARRVVKLTGTAGLGKTTLANGLFEYSQPYPSVVVNADPPITFAAAPNGDLICGSIDMATSPGGSRMLAARWNGLAWSEFAGANGLDASDQSLAGGAPFPPVGVVKSLATLANGNTLFGGLFFFPGDPFNIHFLAMWDGATWTDWGIAFGSVEKILVKSDGHVIIAGNFVNAGGDTHASNIAEWDGTSTFGDGTPVWTGLGFGTDGSVLSIALAPNGDLIAGGEFTAVGNAADADLTVNHVARWDGTMWTRLGSGMSNSVLAVAVMPTGDVVAGGSFTAAVTISGETPTPALSRIARWNGTAWSGLGTGLGSAGTLSFVNNPAGTVFTLAVAPDGVLLVGGDFATANGAPSAFLARWADCIGSCCQANGSCTLAAGSPTASCTSGTLTVGGSCTPNVCPAPSTGVCCRGATCNTTVPSGSCTGSGGIGATFVTTATACNVGGSARTPCCYADFNKNGFLQVQDIFDFLNAWFAGSPFAKVGGDGTAGPLEVADIFAFLNAWFAGGC